MDFVFEKISVGEVLLAGFPKKYCGMRGPFLGSPYLRKLPFSAYFALCTGVYGSVCANFAA